MDKSVLFQNGAAWLRADFHLHTRVDKEFVYDGSEDDFASAYIDRLVEQNIGVGVITNHNKFDKGEFVALKGQIGRACKRKWNSAISRSRILFERRNTYPYCV